MRICAIDPSTKGYGVAFFDGDQITDARYVRHDELRAFASTTELFDLLVVEMPQFYPGITKSPQSLIQLGYAAGFAAACFAARARENIYPRQWTRGIKKDERIKTLKRFVKTEEYPVMRMPTASLQHNVWDAIGLGLWRIHGGLKR